MNTKPTFLHQNRPLNTCMILADNPQTAFHTVLDAQFDGCDAYGLQLDAMKKEFRTEKNIKSIFNAMGSKPIYVTNYRKHYNQGDSDEECVEGLFGLLRCGATLIDVMGDFFCPDPIQLTHDALAIAKQKDTIKCLHEEGAEVLMSSHVMKFMTFDEVLRIAVAHQERGADISKIVTAANSEEEEFENLRTAERLKHELDIPYLFLSGGSRNKLLRQLGPFLGCCMWLTVQRHDTMANPAQPLCRAVGTIADNFDNY